MEGFRGQKFDFTGEDGGWYSVLDDGPALRINMRVTSPVSGVPQITYITGISIMTTDAEGVDHTIVIQARDPHSLEASCPAGVSPCLAEGSLSVHLDGEEVLLAPGRKTLAPDVVISAVNLPGACRYIIIVQCKVLLYMACHVNRRHPRSVRFMYTHRGWHINVTCSRYPVVPNALSHTGVNPTPLSTAGVKNVVLRICGDYAINYPYGMA